MSLWFVPKGAQREPSSEQNDQPAAGLCHSSGTCGSPTKLVEQLSEAKNLAAALEPSEASGDQLANPGPWLKELLRRRVLRSQSPAAGIQGLSFWRNRTPPKIWGAPLLSSGSGPSNRRQRPQKERHRLMSRMVQPLAEAMFHVGLFRLS